MRFFKYLVLIFVSIISVNTFAATYYLSQTPNYESSTYQETCSLLAQNIQNTMGSSSTVYFLKGATLTSYQNYHFVCEIYKDRYGTQSQYGLYYGFERANTCPAKGWPLPVYLPKDTTRIPTRMCKDGCTVEGSGLSIETNNYIVTTMQYTGDSLNCTDAYLDDPPKCDTKDPYGDCFVPPKDNCVRLKDGSIVCPDNITPPENNTCNGADYCKRPPEGCGTGYVSGSFNGQQLCVRSAPNDPKNPPDPDTPDDPNNCMNGGSYCPQPPDNTSCPSGYYETTYNGSKICVRDNLDPTQPNPNDPNNSGGSDNGGGASDPSDGGGDGTGGSINLKPVIDAINNLKNSLVNSISAISTKITSLIEGQKDTNNKLDTSNEHLDKIQEATQATSTAIGETNKKLDQIFSDQGKQQIEQLGEQSTDSRLTSAESEMTSKLQTLANTLSYSSSHACISDFTITDIPYFGATTVPFSKYCDLLALIKLLLKLATLMYALRMIDATVRVF